MMPVVEELIPASSTGVNFSVVSLSMGFVPPPPPVVLVVLVLVSVVLVLVSVVLVLVSVSTVQASVYMYLSTILAFFIVADNEAQVLHFYSAKP